MALAAAPAVRMETILSSQSVDGPHNVDVTPRDAHCCDGPSGTLGSDFSHINAGLSLLVKKKKRLGVDKWRGVEGTGRHWHVRSHEPGTTEASDPRPGLRAGPRRRRRSGGVSLVEFELSGVESTSAGFG